MGIFMYKCFIFPLPKLEHFLSLTKRLICDSLRLADLSYITCGLKREA
jgi:hypothetical protein